MSSITHDEQEIKTKPSIYDKFKKEHDDIFNRLLNILNVKKDDPATYTINKKHIESQKEKIEELYDDITQYYGTLFYKTIKASKDNRHMSIFRQLMKDNGFCVSSKISTKTIDGKQEKNTFYILKCANV
jgi:hypothetical protein